MDALKYFIERGEMDTAELIASAEAKREWGPIMYTYLRDMDDDGARWLVAKVDARTAKLLEKNS